MKFPYILQGQGSKKDLTLTKGLLKYIQISHLKILNLPSVQLTEWDRNGAGTFPGTFMGMFP